MKIPRYMYETNFPVGHPSISLKKAARALLIEASYHHKNGNKEAAWALKNAAYDLERVGGGTTFADAFGWPPLAAQETP